MNLPFKLRTSAQLPKHSDKCIFPSSVLEHALLLHPELPHPLVFQLSASSQVYTGVVEFTALEHEIIVPQDIYDKLNGEEVFIKEANIPKSSYLKIKPNQFYAHVTNWKYYLESFLSTKYTVLTKNQTFYFEDHAAKELVELVVEDCNADSVVVVETNVVLDIVPLDDIMAAQQLEQGFNQSVLNNIPILSERVEVDLKPFSQVSLQHMYRIDLRGKTKNFSIILQCEGDIANVDIICGLDKFLTLECYRWCTLALDSDNLSQKVISIDVSSDTIQNYICQKDINDECWMYFVPFAWDHDTTVSIFEELASEDTRVHESPSEGQTLCHNCETLINSKNFMLHEAVCLRNNRKCSCGLVFEKQIPALHWHCNKCNGKGSSALLKFKHDKLFHSGPYVCNSCSDNTVFDTYIDLVSMHKGIYCPVKLHECRFCHLALPQEESNYEDRFNNVTHHESKCGNKTIECFKCHKSVRSKDLKNHLLLHMIQSSDQEPADVELCANVNCINVLDIPSSTNNSLHLCETCYGPLYSTANDPENIKLQSRLERKYIIQLTRGCNQQWCDNKECATGNTKRDIQAALTHTKEDLLPHIISPPLPCNESRQKSALNRFWFCINESVYRRKLYLQELKGEKRFSELQIYKALSLKGILGAREYLVETA